MAVDHNNPQSRDEEILIATIDGNEYNKAPQSRMEELLLELKETIEEGGGGGGTTNYENLSNQPQINGETLIGDKTGAELGLVDAVEGKGLSTNDYDDTEKAAVAAATSAISAMKDGTDLDSFGDVEVALLDKADTSDLGTAAAKNSTNAVTSGSTDLVESGAVKDAIDAAVSAAYHHAGTKTVAQLTHDLLIASNEGNVYNITDSGTTTSDFIEGIGKTIDEGSNVGICKVGNTYMFDLLSGFVDTTNFVQKSVTAGLLKNDGTVNDEIEGDVNQLKSGLTNLDNEVNGDATVYPYADVITIPDAVPANLADCSVKIEPVQDLHGYDKPWVGGAGKNKAVMVLETIKSTNTGGTWNGNTYTFRGISFEVKMDSDGNITSIVANGTSSDDWATLYLGGTTLPAGSYILSGSNGGSSSTWRITYGSGNIISYDGDNRFTLSDSTTYNVSIIIRTSGTTVNNVAFYPMIRLSTETDATFAPYTNYCPISGHTEASVTCDGDDVWNGERSYSESSAGFVIGNHNIALPAGSYMLEFDAENPSNSVEVTVYKNNSLQYADELARYSSPAVSHNILPFTIAEAATNMRLYANKNTGLSISNVRLYKTRKTYTLALGDTIYGGTVDFKTGKVRMTHAITDLGDFTWENDYASLGMVRTTSSISDAVNPPNNATKANIISDRYIVLPYYVNGQEGVDNCSTDGSIGITGTAFGNKVSIRDINLANMTPEQIKSAVTGYNVCYELATPTTIQLTPQQIQLLKGQNTLYASTGDISVTVNGVSGAIGSVQEQVNELAEEVADVQSGLAKLHYHKVAESAATGTRTDKLASLYTTYNTLSNDVRKSAILLRNNADIFHAVNNSGTFSNVYVDTSTMLFMCATLNPGSYIFNNNGTTTDGSSAENTEVWSLWIIE